jgi:hypothetical protein
MRDGKYRGLRWCFCHLCFSVGRDENCKKNDTDGIVSSCVWTLYFPPHDAFFLLAVNHYHFAVEHFESQLQCFFVAGQQEVDEVKRNWECFTQGW